MSVLGYLMIVQAFVFAAVVVSPKPKLPLLFEFGLAASAFALFLVGESLASSGSVSGGKLSCVLVGAGLMAASLLKEGKRTRPTSRPSALSQSEWGRVQGGKK